MKPLPIAVFISGGGTTLKNLVALRQSGQLDVDFRLVISSSSRAGGLQIAAAAGIASQVVDKRDYAGDDSAYSNAMFDPCRDSGARLVVMAGFLKHVLIPADFDGRVINIHPSLIPSFCGAGMYGRHVHQAAIDFGVRVSGCTVHFVDNQYDHGPILLQRCCEVTEDDTAETLAARVFQQECRALPDAIRWFAKNRGLDR
jgi:phosphoribosylglycinamide formyltransferase-1